VRRTGVPVPSERDFWPGHSWSLDFDKFAERKYRVDFTDPEGYPAKSQVYGDVYTAKPLPVLNY